jgi:chloramphenicol O-acetyltransferase type B
MVDDSPRGVTDDRFDRSPLAPALTKNKLSEYRAKGYPISIGRGSYGGPNLHWDYGDFSYQLIIGSYCSIADDVDIFVGRHGRHTIDYVSTYPLGMVYGDPACRTPSRMASGDLGVTIGNDVWVGRNATIMAGVTIGDGAVVGARALVNKDVAPYSVVGGLPATHIKYRFDHDTIKKLLKIEWWYWSDELIAERREFFATPKFMDLLDKYVREKADE